MEGILIIDKPEGFTSFDVVAKLRGILKTRKIGHAGTLDPMATGVLPILVGRATKCCDILPNQDKSYTAQFELGYTTDTLDRTGTRLTTCPVKVTPAQVEEVLERFRGPIWQLPPMYSAVQVGGRRLYDLARQGILVERERRPVEIHRLELVQTQPVEHRYTIQVSCSKGTYIRTLCADIGEALGCGATMTALRRTSAAGFTLEEALTLEELSGLAQEGRAQERLLPIHVLFGSLPALELSGRQETMYRNGVRLDGARLRWPSGVPLAQQGEEGWQLSHTGDLRVLDSQGQLMGLSFLDGETGQLCSRKFFA